MIGARILGWGMLSTSLIAAGALAWGARVDTLRARHLSDLTAERTARKGDQANWRAASAEAQRRADARVTQALDDERQSNREATDALRADLADTDAAYRRLLAATARADTGGGDRSGVPGPVPPRCFADGTACTPEILATLKAAEEQAARLDRLQGAIRAYQLRQGASETANPASGTAE